MDADDRLSQDDDYREHQLVEGATSGLARLKSIRRSRKAVVRIVLGLPAAGKTTALPVIFSKHILKTSILLDPDDVRKKLPEYTPATAGLFDREAADIERTVLSNKIYEGSNLIITMVGKNVDRVDRLIELLIEAGYRVELILIDLKPEIAATRAVERFTRKGRFVDPRLIIETLGRKPQSTYRALRMKAAVSASYSNDVPKGQKMVCTERNRADSNN
jgi:hypothetical protein